MLKPKGKITIREENSVFFSCFVWYLSYGREKNIIIIYVDFFLFLGFERHAPSYHLTKKVWWCSTTIKVKSLPLVFTSNLERGRRCYYCCYQLFMAICIPNVLKVTSTQTWKITSMWKFSFYEHLSSPHWSMSEQFFIPKSKSCTYV